MSNRKKTTTAIADQINDALKPKELYEEETECNAEIEDFDEGSDADEKTHKKIQFSDFRKKNAPQLHEVDKKYSGKVVSRKEMQEELNSESDDDEDIEEEDSTEGGSSPGGSSEEEEQYEDSDDVEVSSEQDSDEDDDEDEFDISQFDNASSSKSPSESAKVKSSLKIMDSKLIGEEIKKGESVQNQQKIWEKLLEVRIKAQKMMTTANALPDYDAHIELLEVDDDGQFSDKIEETSSQLYNLLDNLIELQSNLVKNYSETKNLTLKRKSKSKSGNILMKRSKLAEYADLVEENYDSYSDFRTKTLQKWHERTKSVKEMKGSLGNIDIMTKIQNAMLKKDEIIKKTQLYRGGYSLFGKDAKIEDDIHSPEIFDDSEFYHQQLRELIEYKSGLDENQAEITQKLIELQKVRGKMKKRIDTRASKGRKIRYIVHNKLVNFMAPRDESTMPDEARKELFNSLFGAANEGELL